MKQTAVEFLVNQLEQNKFITKSQIHIAKEMEKQQIVDAYDVLWVEHIKNGEDYYNETFKK
jgi:hypothetical protein